MQMLIIGTRLRLLLILVSVLLLSISVQAQDRLPIIFVKQIPVDFTVGTIADIFNNIEGEVPRLAQPVGGGLFRLDPDGTLTDLTSMENIAVRDPEISYDGTRVIFSMKRGGQGKWQIYEMGVDGTDLHKISRSVDVNDWDPAYMPNGQILFLSDRLERIARFNENISPDKLPEGLLFRMNGDGSNVEIINANPNGSFNPLVGDNGLIYFTQWDLNDVRRSPLDPVDGISYSRFLLWETLIDGSREGHPIFGAHIVEDFAGGFMEARELPDGSGDMVATFTQSQYTWGAGSIVRFTPRSNANLDEVAWLTDPEGYSSLDSHTNGRYRSPYPLQDGRILASYAPGSVWDNGENMGGAPDFDLILLTEDRHEVIHADPDFWDWQAVEVTPRSMPELLQPQTFPEYQYYAVVNTRDVELRHLNGDYVVNGDHQPDIRQGDAAGVRIYALDRPPAPYAGGDPEEQNLVRRFLGEAPVHDDGSFAAIVPARTLLIWEVVDADGNMLVTERVWQEFAPGEVRTCNGCHSPHDGSQGRSSNLALLNPFNATSFDVDTNADGQVDLIVDYLAQFGEE